MSTAPDLPRALDVARAAVAAAGAAALAWFGRDVPKETKADRSPATRADHDADAAIVAVIREAFPDHDILSEESGTYGPGTCDCRWVVDPIDGTRGFIRGDHAWGPLIALEHRGEIVVAAIGMPALGVTWWATKGGGTWRDGERLCVSTVVRWPEATLVVGYLRGLLGPPHGPGVLELMRTADRVRCPGDLAGCVAVIEGRAEAWLEAGVREWDLAAPRLLVQEAGGRFTDLLGRSSHALGTAVGTNGVLHPLVLRAVRGG